MQLSFILSKVEPGNVQWPKVCLRPGCEGRYFKPFREATKQLRDAHCSEVKAYCD